MGDGVALAGGLEAHFVLSIYMLALAAGFYGIPTAILLVTFVVEALLRGRRSRKAALASGHCRT